MISVTLIRSLKWKCSPLNRLNEIILPYQGIVYQGIALEQLLDLCKFLKIKLLGFLLGHPCIFSSSHWILHIFNCCCSFVCMKPYKDWGRFRGVEFQVFVFFFFFFFKWDMLKGWLGNRILEILFPDISVLKICHGRMPPDLSILKGPYVKPLSLKSWICSEVALESKNNGIVPDTLSAYWHSRRFSCWTILGDRALQGCKCLTCVIGVARGGKGENRVRTYVPMMTWREERTLA